MPDLAGYDELKAKLGDREWRLDNLYWIQNEKGEAVRFVRNDAQRAFWGNLWYVNLILKARQLGFSTFIAILLLDECLFNSDTATGIIDLTLVDAKKKLAKIKFAYDRLPPTLREARPIALDTKTKTELVFGNGSSVGVGTSHRGGTLQHLHVSEYGKISATAPERAREIKNGAFGTIHVGQRIDIESTAEGQGGEFYELVQRAEALQKEGRPLSEMDFRLHFFPWWRHAGYRLNPSNVQIPLDLVEYFAELEGKHGIKLDVEQKAWYAAKRYQIGPDDIFKEYPSVPEEAFKASVEGAYFKTQMSAARLQGRIGHMPHDPNRVVNTFWDIGMDDYTAIWFHQSDGVRHRLIDYYENSGEGVAHYVKVLEDRKDGAGAKYKYGKHFGPHDLQVRDWSGTGKTRKDVAEGLGLEFDVVPAVDDKADAIEATRAFLATTWMDAVHCERGIQCLDNYCKKWNDQRGCWSDQPNHNWASHGADGLMTGVIGFVPDRILPREDRHRRGRAQSQSAWGA